MDKQKKRWAFIVNPVAGNGYGSTIVPVLEDNIRKRGIDAEIKLTGHPGHAVVLAGEFHDKGFSHIIGAGGDGTFNEIARALAGKKDIVTGLIPAGTGNDFIQILGFPDRFSDSDWDIFFREETASIDAGFCNGIIFMNGMGLGFDAQVASENYSEDGTVKKGSKYKYIWHILKTLLFYRERKMTVVTPEGRHETDCFINTVAIGRRFAGGFLLTPEAIANDGLLDVCSIRRLSLPERLKILMMVPKGTHIKDKRINYYKTASLHIEFSRKVPFHADGELHFASAFDVSVLPEALNIIYNPGGNHFFRR
ncbi:MAG: diacylglycerol kinase family lipid kinase [Bacteroidales bacterium]|jgi:YegS/Rv2252/BmrU family lipid kinase|nr:diacylglycerol kinase family lipid kinase [Bacteroidales bacterium]MCU0407360.1 diacylglycerol kinase family lipid kinase [Bacteroidales bacterium]